MFQTKGLVRIIFKKFKRIYLNCAKNIAPTLALALQQNQILITKTFGVTPKMSFFNTEDFPIHLTW